MSGGSGQGTAATNGTLIVEDGTGVSGANAYGMVSEADDYHSARGNTDWTAASSSPDQGKSAAIVRGTAALDAIYGGRFPGYRLLARSQGLEWPREGAYDREYNVVPANEVPVEIKYACFEMALREYIEPGSMMPDLERGGQIRAMSAGSVSIEYGSNAAASTTFQLIAGLLNRLMLTAAGPFARSVRG